MKYVFEDMDVEIFEDKVVNDVNYDIQDNKLISKQTLCSTISSSIYNYPDGFSLYLKFDESGLQKMVSVMLAVYLTQKEKCLGSFPESAEVSIKRFDNNFILKMEDELNGQGSLVFITVKVNGDVVKVTQNFTKLVNFEVIENKYVVANTYEVINDKFKIWVTGVYQLSGKPYKVFVDKKFNNTVSFVAETTILRGGRKMVFIGKTKNGKTKRCGLFDLKIKVPVQKMKNTKKKTKHGWFYRFMQKKKKKNSTIKKLKEANKQKEEELEKLKEKVEKQKIKLMKDKQDIDFAKDEKENEAEDYSKAEKDSKISKNNKQKNNSQKFKNVKNNSKAKKTKNTKQDALKNDKKDDIEVSLYDDKLEDSENEQPTHNQSDILEEKGETNIEEPIQSKEKDKMSSKNVSKDKKGKEDSSNEELNENSDEGTVKNHQKETKKDEPSDNDKEKNLDLNTKDSSKQDKEENSEKISKGQSFSEDKDLLRNEYEEALLDDGDLKMSSKNT